MLSVSAPMPGTSIPNGHPLRSVFVSFSGSHCTALLRCHCRQGRNNIRGLRTPHCRTIRAEGARFKVPPDSSHLRCITVELTSCTLQALQGSSAKANCTPKDVRIFSFSGIEFAVSRNLAVCQLRAVLRRRAGSSPDETCRIHIGMLHFSYLMPI